MLNLWDIPAIDQHGHNLLTPEAAVKDSDLTVKEAESVAVAILSENARRLYLLKD